MKLLKIIIILAGCLISMTGLASADSKNISLAGAIEMALQEDEAYLISLKELNKADGQIIEALSSALPQITGGFQYMRNWRVPTSVFQMDNEITTLKFGTEQNYTADITLTLINHSDIIVSLSIA